jgi:hypothetical protein
MSVQINEHVKLGKEDVTGTNHMISVLQNKDILSDFGV